MPIDSRAITPEPQSNSIDIEKMNQELLKPSKSSSLNEKQIDSENDRYPYCIVWTPLPLIT